VRRDDIPIATAGERHTGRPLAIIAEAATARKIGCTAASGRTSWDRADTP